MGGFEGDVQRFLIARHTEVLHQPVDGKRVGDDAVFASHDLVAGFIYDKDPVPVLIAPAALQEAILINRSSPPGLSGIRTKVFRVRVMIRNAVDKSRESPQCPGVRPDVLVVIQNRAVIGQASPHSAVLPVNTVPNPKRYDVLRQMVEQKAMKLTQVHDADTPVDQDSDSSGVFNAC